MMDKLALIISRDLARATPEEKLKTFIGDADTYGRFVRDGHFNGDAAALEQTLWDVAIAEKLTGEPGSDAQQNIEDVIERATAIARGGVPRATNGHDREEVTAAEATNAPLPVIEIKSGELS